MNVKNRFQRIPLNKHNLNVGLSSDRLHNTLLSTDTKYRKPQEAGKSKRRNIFHWQKSELVSLSGLVH